MRGRKRHRKKANTLFVGQPRLRARAIAEAQQFYEETLRLMIGTFVVPRAVAWGIGQNHYTEEQIRGISELGARLRNVMPEGLNWGPSA